MNLKKKLTTKHKQPLNKSIGETMNHLKKFSNILEDYFTQIGLDDLKLSSEGSFGLNFNPGIDVSFHLNKATNYLYIYAILPIKNSLENTGLLIKILQANHFWKNTGGATLSLNKEATQIFLSGRHSINNIQKTNDLEEIIESLINNAEKLTKEYNHI